jgi:hypothetical protein
MNKTAKSVSVKMLEWRDGQPLCANYYSKSPCQAVLEIGASVYKVSHLYYCASCKGPRGRKP